MNNNYQGSYQGSYGGGQQNVQQQASTNYTVDMVLCIDATGSMENLSGGQDRIINMVKKNASNLYDDVTKRMKEKNKPMAQLRVRVIIFRDYLADGPAAMKATDFFLLPQQAKEFVACINGITAKGGGDIPEDGLEALAYAMKSKWTSFGAKKRQVIVVWTDAGTHELGYGKKSPFYPKGMPANLSELEDWWEEMNDYAKRLIIFAPDTNYWNYISENWEKVVHVHSVAGEGMSEHNYNAILDMITNTI